MKKIGILAIGTMIFLSVSCTKNNLQPSNASVEREAPTPHKLGAPLKDETGLTLGDGIINENERRPIRGIRNENELPTTYNPEKTWIGTIRNENEFPTTHNPEKIPVRGVRNDENINSNTSDL